MRNQYAAEQVGGANLNRRVQDDLNTFRGEWDTYNEVKSASMELSAESCVVVDLAKTVFRLCGRGTRVSRETDCRGSPLQAAT